MSHSAPQANSFETSRFCQRLQSLARAQGSTTTLENLSTATKRLVSHAGAISDQIVRHLPQFTLHNGTHLWNVLSFMEELAGGAEAIDKLGAGDCAMAVWAAFTHDLGMVLEASELAALDAADHFDTSPDVQGKATTWGDQRVQDWRAYRDGHEHWSAIRLDPNSEKSRMKLGIIRAAFIRDSHARQDAHSGHCRIADWLAFIAGTDRLIAQALEDFSLDERIVRVAVSHNQGIAWLPRQLSALACSDPHAEHDAELGTIHWTWIGWLLRLADVFDCDASRTPRILFDHSGIEDARSRTEWQKHLAVRNPPTWGAGNDNQTLLYTCHLSPSPVVEKAIHQIIGWMNDEIAKCRAAWNALSETQRRDLTLALPSEAKPDIKKRAGDYLYQDIEFRLDRDAVVELLMGESLYGGPELALRELVQNALDAVHLRDQRNKLAIALEQAGNNERARQPHEPWGATTGEVHVTWGTETDGKKRSWIKVQDNGVGMTVATMRRFLTQIGKSYYKSDDFHAEQELMRRHGILCTAISQFGIGFLSVFMLADHVEIHTRPIEAKDHPDKTKPNWQETESFPFRADIHGPHGLLAFYPDDVRQTGTTVTLWLKDKFVLARMQRDRVIAQLKQEFYAISLSGELAAKLEDEKSKLDGKQLLDVAFDIGRFMAWPLFPVEVGSQTEGIVLSEGFHLAELLPFDPARIADMAMKLDGEFPEIGTAAWKACEWTDAVTGSRVRVVAAHLEADVPRMAGPEDWARLNDVLVSGSCRMALHVASAHALPIGPARYLYLVNGVRVLPGLEDHFWESQVSEVATRFPLNAGPGAQIWIDFRGAATPRLRADRSALTRSQPSGWDPASLYKRWLRAWPTVLPAWVLSLIPAKEFTERLLPPSRDPIRLGIGQVSATFVTACLIAEHHSPPERLRKESWPAPSSYCRDYLLGEVLSHAAFEVFGDESLSAVPIWNCPNRYAAALAGECGLPRGWMTMHEYLSHGQDGYPHPKPTRSSLDQFVNLHFVSEALWSHGDEAHPVLNLKQSSDLLTNYRLVGPLHVSSDRQSLGEFAEYDVIAPFTGFPLKHLTKQFPSWGHSRGHRALWMLPLLMGDEPLPDWRDKLRKERPFDRLMLFMPNPDHYEWLFAEHTQEEWSQGSASALWDLETGQVLYADGIHSEASLRAEGKPLREWLGIK